MSDAKSIILYTSPTRMRLPVLGIDDIVSFLRLDKAPETWRSSWWASQAAFARAPRGWLQERKLRDACGDIGISKEVTEACAAAAEGIRAAPILLRLAWHCAWQIFLSGKPAPEAVLDWPNGKPLPPLFHAVVLLSGFDFTAALHSARGIPPLITRETLKDLELWILDHKTRTGEWGFRTLSWLSLHFTALVFQLGRLQFEIKRNEHGFHVLRHAITQNVKVLAGEGMVLRGDGQFADADGMTAGEDAWTARYQRGIEGIKGHQVDRTGCVARPELQLPLSEWKEELVSGDPVLGVHIPASGSHHGPLRECECRDSFREAVAFFADRFPDHPFRGFTCASWLLDGQLQRYLPPESNIVSFQGLFHLIPLPGANDAQMKERVFGSATVDLNSLPLDSSVLDTSLQRIAVRHVKAGGRWRMGGGLRLRDEALEPGGGEPMAPGRGRDAKGIRGVPLEH